MTFQLPQILLKAVQTGILNKYFIVSAESILFYDYIIMLPAEIEHIWFTKWGVGNVLYMLTRYMAFVEAALLVNYAFNTGIGHSENSQTLCEAIYRAGCWVKLAVIMVAYNIIHLRTAAIWGWSKRSLCCVGIANAIFDPVAIYAIQSYLSSMKYSKSPVPGIAPCYAVFTKSLLYMDFALALAIEFGVLILTLYKRYATWPQNPSPLLRMLYRDAILFFGCLCVVSIINLVLFASPHLSEYYQLLVQFQSAMHSITTARIILHLRITGANPTLNDGSVLLSMEFMRKKNPPRSPGYIEDVTESDSQSRWESMEMHGRVQRRNSFVVCEERERFLVINPYMI